jgi:hypothetical protein
MSRKRKPQEVDDFMKWRHAETFLKLLNPKLPRIGKIDWTKPLKRV